MGQILSQDNSLSNTLHPPIHPFNKHIMGSAYEPGSILGTETIANKHDRSPCLHGVHMKAGEKQKINVSVKCK